MVPEIKQKLVEALRSGKYRQAAGALKKRVWVHDIGEQQAGYCCLGVLCDVMGCTWQELQHGTTHCSLPFIDDKDVSFNEYLSDSMLEKVGLTDEQQKELARLNDEGRSFNDIAEHIERNL